MSRSRKKVCGGTICCCKSQKRGKQIASRRFRRNEHRLIAMGKYYSLPIRSRELTSPWDLGGDGKTVYSRTPGDEVYERYIRK